MIVHPTYFGPIIQFVAMMKNEGIALEVHDNFQKQTYRNRCYIYGANGKQLLTVPVVHTKKDNHQKTSGVQIDYSFAWQKLHIKSIQTAYRSSPFFEYYEDDIIPIIEKKHKFLMDLNIETHHIIFDVLQHEFQESRTSSYEKKYDDLIDFRNLVNAKSKTIYDLDFYQQVFGTKYNYIPNLSILDLLFNEGPNSLKYLEDQQNKLVN